MSVNAESMKAIRKELKELYPNLKFSVRKVDFCCVHVDVLEGNINFFQYVTERGKSYYTNETRGYRLHWHKGTKHDTVLNDFLKCA